MVADPKLHMDITQVGAPKGRPRAQPQQGGTPMAVACGRGAMKGGVLQRAAAAGGGVASSAAGAEPHAGEVNGP